MSNRLNASGRKRSHGLRALVAMVVLCLCFSGRVHGQTASTGALTGVTLDPSGAVLPDVVVTLVNQKTMETLSTTSNKEGLFAFLSLLPGRYELRANKADFEPLCIHAVSIHVTETLRLELGLQLALRFERAEVSSNPPMIQTETSALGRVVNDSAVSGLPMINRKF